MQSKLLTYEDNISGDFTWALESVRVYAAVEKFLIIRPARFLFRTPHSAFFL